ncbi:XLF-domain-containing protein [Sodiomyces alkalinus F11]|uniref:Non-homologous end-joining factor 1 n=1 Tax=Sodiomyces alkalinus (strain CBS 110278 / VKM F-3762 / F11) TaxID=1314773 RepID=A0A3N2PYA1_SODAK|nr:XLF-domain-containing protein [Sodiomyces alkalinus F11]ROT39477.1 XLF-domain-containing protein [Sodiomyces alkalinus F11]
MSLTTRRLAEILSRGGGRNGQEWYQSEPEAIGKEPRDRDSEWEWTGDVSHQTVGKKRTKPNEASWLDSSLHDHIRSKLPQDNTRPTQTQLSARPLPPDTSFHLRRIRGQSREIPTYHLLSHSLHMIHFQRQCKDPARQFNHQKSKTDAGTGRQIQVNFSKRKGAGTVRVYGHPSTVYVASDRQRHTNNDDQPHPYRAYTDTDTMDTPPSWRPLAVPAPHGVPALLVSTAFATDSYTIRVTDMANLWAEVMDRRAIYRRSLDEDTTIDPTDSPQNMQAFLSRIRSAFDPSHEDHADSRLTLSVDPPSGRGGDHVLVLNMTCELPGLDPLRWPMVLHRCPPSQLATELVLPLIQANLTRTQQVNSLLDIIHQKDAVLARLLDKLEATGTRLEHIFPALSAKQRVSRSTAEQKVRGLAPFKREVWDDQQAARDELPKDVPSLTEAVFGETGLAYHSGMDVCDSPALDNWWTKLGSASSIPIIGPRRGNSQTQNKTLPLQSRTADDADEDDDVFETQATPPPRPSARQHAEDQRKANGDDESTLDEDGSPSPPPAEPSDAGKGKHRPPSRLGAIGKKKRPSPTPPRPPRPSTPGGDGSETESQTESDLDEEPRGSGSTRDRPAPPSSLAGTTPKKRGGLGRIGGTKREEPAPSSRTEDTPAATAPEKRTPRKLGKIGHKSVATHPPDGDGDGDGEGHTRGRTTERDPEPEARETSEERANRKREELKKELERKAAAGPARKKRKF